MPEGDTLFQVARLLRPLLVGQRLVRAELPRARPETGRSLVGRAVTAVEAQGKHLFIELDDARTLRTHLGMHGSWHRYPLGAKWKRPARQVAVRLGVGELDVICFGAMEVELMRKGGVSLRRLSQRLGPDLCASEVDPSDLAVSRARQLHAGDRPIIDVLLDQRVAVGIGNVYKSEVLFVERRHPLARLETFDDPALARLYSVARELLRRNLEGGPRRTRFVDERSTAEVARTERLWVYGRGGLPCFRCGTRIVRERLGDRRRVTDWCPSCVGSL